MQVIRSLALFALVSAAALVSSGYGAGEGSETPCSAAPSAPSLELVYRSEAGEEAVTQSARDRVITILCERLWAFTGVEGEVRAFGGRRVRVLLPRGAAADKSRHLADLIGATGQLYFYDWEPNLIGPERVLGGLPGMAPSVRAMRRAEREWRAAGRDPNQPANGRLILAGAFPNAYGAVKLASEQEPREPCEMCSASSPRFYMFDRSTARRLIAGPATTKGDLRSDAARRHHRHGGIVLKVPVGTAIFSEQPTGRLGWPIATGEPGWFALKDRFALSGEEITDPKQEVDEFGQPNVTFGFTGKGRAAFQKLTREVAYRGQARAIGPVDGKEAEEISGHFALIFDREIKTRPIIYFPQNPDGIDGRTGAQISGGFASAQEARDLATILRIGALPINLALIRHVSR